MSAAYPLCTHDASVIPFLSVRRLHQEPLQLEPLGFLFLAFFATILVIQFFSMLWHRYGTFLHIIASTDLRYCQKRVASGRMDAEEAVATVKQLQTLKGEKFFGKRRDIGKSNTVPPSKRKKPKKQARAGNEIRLKWINIHVFFYKHTLFFSSAWGCLS